MVGPDYVEPSVGALESDLKAEHFFRDEGLWKEAVPMDSLQREIGGASSEMRSWILC
ncbi:MAG: hypothetical protein ACLUKN_05830 [Bacilli bacterium]